MTLSQPAKWEKYFWPLLLAALFLVFWHYAVIYSASKVFPSPLKVFQGAEELAKRGVLVRYIADSLSRVGIGFTLAAVLAIPFGLTLGWYPAASQVVNPVIQMVRPISPIAWIPLAIVFFGVGNTSAVFLIFLASFFPITVAAMNGVRNVPSMYRRAGRNFGLSPAGLLMKVVFPAALPQIIIGLRIALGIAWLVVVAAEMIAVDSGLGYLVIDARNSGNRYDLVIAAMIMIGLIGLGLDSIFRSLEKIHSLRWGFRLEA
jgi:NitT/TauT family transport system permease protein